MDNNPGLLIALSFCFIWPLIFSLLAYPIYRRIENFARSRDWRDLFPGLAAQIMIAHQENDNDA